MNRKNVEELYEILRQYVRLKSKKNEGILSEAELAKNLHYIISKLNKLMESTNKEWLIFLSADIAEELYGGLNDISAKYYYLSMNFILHILESLIIVWFEDKTGFFKKNINPILLGDAIDRLMYAIKGLENIETYNILGGLFKKIIENLDKKTYRNVWNNLWKRSRDYYLRSLSLNAENVEALEGLGDLYLLIEEYNNALNYYTKALIIEKANVRLLSKVAFIFENLGYLDKAIEVLEEARTYNESEEINRKLIELYKQMGNMKKVKDLDNLLKKKTWQK